MVLYLQNKSIWDKIKNNESLDCEDIENYVYSEEYLSITSPKDFAEINDEFNPNLNKYFFEVEEYINEDEYKEVFFQSYLDGEINRENYIYFENKFLKLLNNLFDTGLTFVYYCFSTKPSENYVLKQCKDILINKEFLEKYNNKVFKITDKETFKTISILMAREAMTGYFIFPNIKSIFINSGMHGYLLSEKEINPSVINS